MDKPRIQITYHPGRGREPLHAMDWVEEDTARCFDALPKNREIDPRDMARAMMQQDERRRLSVWLGQAVAARLLNLIESHDTKNGYPGEGKHHPAAYSFASLGHAFARLVMADGSFDRVLSCYPQGTAILEELRKYLQRERFMEEPGHFTHAIEEADYLLEVLKALNTR